MNRALLFAFAPIALGLLGLACNGRVVSDDTGSLSSKAKTGEAQKEEQTSDATNAHPVQGATAPAPSCSYEYQSSSSSGDPPLVFSCESTDNYTCDDGPKDITCSCSGSQGAWSKGSCSCHGITFEFDCNGGCSPTAAEYARCNLPAPPSDTGGGGVSSGSSSGG